MTDKKEPLMVSSIIKSDNTLVAFIARLRNKYLEKIVSYQNLKKKTKESLKKIKELNKDIAELNDSLKNIEGRYSLVCSAVSPKNILSEKYERFHELVDQNLLPLINRVNILPNDAEQIIKIHAIEDELRMADSLSAFAERTIVAVAGGFSSGKSSFISSLFDVSGFTLPVGIEPVTSIPTYVSHADQLTIKGYPTKGGFFEISQELYTKLSHKFIEEFGFNLRDLLPRVSLEVPMRDFRNLAFIDLPGYNPGSRSGSTSGDSSITGEFVTQAQALLWMISLDSNGTIPQEDIDHLYDLEVNDIPLFIVLNKADLRPRKVLNEVLDEISGVLMTAGISYEGLCAYSSEDRKEISFRKSCLWDVLRSWDVPRCSTTSIQTKMKEIFSTYEAAFLNDIKHRKLKSGLLKSLELNLLELGAFEETDLSLDFDLDSYLNDGSDSAFKLEKSYSGDDSRERSDLINAVREQIQEMRDDYRIDKAEKELIELRRINEGFQQLFEGTIPA